MSSANGLPKHIQDRLNSIFAEPSHKIAKKGTGAEGDYLEKRAGCIYTTNHDIPDLEGQWELKSLGVGGGSLITLKHLDCDKLPCVNGEHEYPTGKVKNRAGGTKFCKKCDRHEREVSSLMAMIPFLEAYGQPDLKNRLSLRGIPLKFVQEGDCLVIRSKNDVNGSGPCLRWGESRLEVALHRKLGRTILAFHKGLKPDGVKFLPTYLYLYDMVGGSEVIRLLYDRVLLLELEAHETMPGSMVDHALLRVKKPSIGSGLENKGTKTRLSVHDLSRVWKKCTVYGPASDPDFEREILQQWGEAFRTDARTTHPNSPVHSAPAVQAAEISSPLPCACGQQAQIGLDQCPTCIGVAQRELWDALVVPR